jgi:3,4-dihydroxy 2-butanone 4-phosphate synthase/GTP cyclohydrolase II
MAMDTFSICAITKVAALDLPKNSEAYILQNQGLDTVDANLQLGHSVDSRDWTEAIAILKNLNLTSIQLLTNNPEKV